MTTARWSWSTISMLLSLGAAACGGSGGPERPAGASASAPQTGALPAGHPEIPQVDAEVAAMGDEGVVVETMDAGGYTYARLETAEGDIWAAGPVTPLAKGTVVSLAGGAMMSDFHSSSLDKTFEKILFFGAFSTPAAAGPMTEAEALEVLDAAGYTYVRAEVEGAEVWVVGPATPIKAGQTVAWTGGTTMRDFSSASLQRTFAAILFVESLTVR